MPRIAPWGHHSFLEDSPGTSVPGRILADGCDDRPNILLSNRVTPPSEAEVPAADSSRMRTCNRITSVRSEQYNDSRPTMGLVGNDGL